MAHTPRNKERKQSAPGSYAARRRAHFRGRLLQETISKTKTSCRIIKLRLALD